MPEAVLYGEIDSDNWSETWPLQLSFAGDTIPGNCKGLDAEATLWLRYNLSAVRDVSIAVCYESLEREESPDTLTLSLYNSAGKPEGEGVYGVYEVCIPLKDKIKMEDGLVFRLWPIGDASGVTDAGITFYRPGEREHSSSLFSPFHIN